MTTARPSSLPDLLDARYATPMPSATDGNATLNTLLAHRSVRAYSDQPLPVGTLETLVAAAQSASTSSNLQTWSVVAVEDAERKAKLAQLAGDQKHVRDCPLFLVWLADLSRLKTLGEKRQVPHASLDYLEMFLVGALDAGLASQNAAVAAESLGLGVVYIGALRNEPEKVAEVLGLPPRAFAVFGMCVGYPDPARPASIKPRLPQAAVLHRETYDATQTVPAVDAYNDIMTTFYAAQEMKNQGPWDLHSLQRVRGPEAMKGRDVLVQALKRMGFPLG